MKKRKESFTLIEMLVVISIIAILAGLSFKMMQLAKRNADRAATVAKLEKVAHALNEYKAEYGCYPPAGKCKKHADCRVCYNFENTNAQSSFVVTKLFDDPTLLEDMFQFGLVAFFETRDKDVIAHKNHPAWSDDNDRDKLAKQRFSVFLEGVIQDGGSFSNQVEGSSAGTTGSYAGMKTRTIKDSWDQVIKYVSDPPYMTYKLWSKGPDKTDGTVDDIHKNSWDN